MFVDGSPSPRHSDLPRAFGKIDFARFLALIGEYDRRQGWRGSEYHSTCEWLVGRCGLDARSAREHVRIARALRDLPLIRAAFTSGELSYSKVRALTRSADRVSEEVLLETARQETAAELETRLRNVPRPPRDAASNTQRSRENLERTFNHEVVKVHGELSRQFVEPSATETESTRTIYKRSRKLRTYVRARAAGICEGCERPAPFTDRMGQPYLEPHHIRRVSDGGPDDPRWVIALCPTCHARIHYGADGDEYNADLMKRLATIESPVGETRA